MTVKPSLDRRVVVSVICFLSFLLYGASCGSLGAAVPLLAARYALSSSAAGMLFMARGAGYTLGALCSAGLGYGAMDVFANCLLPALWGAARVQPWMQALHTSFGVGSIAGPAMVALAGVRVAYAAFAATAGVPLLLLLVWRARESKRESGRERERESGCVCVWSLCDVCVCCVRGAQSDVRHSFVAATQRDVALADCEDDTHCERETQRATESESESESDCESATPHNATTQPTTPTHTLTDTHTIETVSLTQPQRPSPPLSVRLCVSLFLFVYVGLIVSLLGWIPTYALDTGVAKSVPHAAYLCAIFNFAATIGRLLSISLAVYCSASALLRGELVWLVCVSVWALWALCASYVWCVVVTAGLALALCAVYPATMTVVADYGFELTSGSTTMMIVGGTLGEAIIPICFGVAMHLGGSRLLPLITLLCALTMCVLYACVHCLSVQAMESVKRQELGVSASQHGLLFVISDEESEEHEDAEQRGLEMT